MLSVLPLIENWKLLMQSEFNEENPIRTFVYENTDNGEPFVKFAILLLILTTVSSIRSNLR